MPANSDRRGEELLQELANDASTLQYDEPDVAEGECRYCGCTEDYACVLTIGSGVRTCGWYKQPNHHGLGVCSNPECVKAYLADAGAP